MKEEVKEEINERQLSGLKRIAHMILFNSLSLPTARVSDSLALGMHRLPPWRKTGMWTLRARLSTIAATILILSFASRPAFARGSHVGHDDPWSSERITRLPPEVRNAIIHMCADPRAGQYFATYFDNSHLIKLHFEHVHCNEQAAFCRAGSCLRQEYISTGGHYRLMRSYYGPNND